MELLLTLGAIQHRKSSETRVASYVSGVESYPNPARPSAENAVARAQASFESIEQETLDREARCNRLRTPRACDSYNAIVPTYNQRRQALTQAQENLERTPVTLQRDIIERVRYTVHHHVWSVPYSVFARSLSGAEASQNGVFTRTDSEHEGVAPAGIEADPLIVPGAETFNDDLVRVARTVGKSVLAVAFKQRAACADQPWDLDDPLALDCRARSELYAKGDLPAPRAWNLRDCR